MGTGWGLLARGIVQPAVPDDWFCLPSDHGAAIRGSPQVFSAAERTAIARAVFVSAAARSPLRVHQESASPQDQPLLRAAMRIA